MQEPSAAPPCWAKARNRRRRLRQRFGSRHEARTPCGLRLQRPNQAKVRGERRHSRQRPKAHQGGPWREVVMIAGGRRFNTEVAGARQRHGLRHPRVGLSKGARFARLLGLQRTLSTAHEVRRLGRRRPKIPAEVSTCTGICLGYALAIAGYRCKSTFLCTVIYKRGEQPHVKREPNE